MTTTTLSRTASRLPITGASVDCGGSWRGGIAGALSRAFAAYLARADERRQLRHLLSLDDHLLSDVGISRSEAEEAYRNIDPVQRWL